MCPMPDGDEIISIGISPNEVNIEIGESYQMTRSVAPQNLASLPIWCSNNNNIARVSTSGIVTGVSEGRTTIYSTSPDHTVRSNDAVVTVRKKTVKVTSISIPSSLSLVKGRGYSLTANVSPSNAANKTVSWHTADSSIVGINLSTGYVTAKAVGSTYVYATSNDGTNIYSNRCYITVTSNLVSSISITPAEKTLRVGNEFDLYATVSPSNAANKTVRWYSTSPSVASVSESCGTVRAIASGVANIYAVSTDGSNVRSNVCAVTVRQDTGAATISMTNECVSGVIGESRRLTVSVSPASAASAGIEWGSGNVKIATVDGTGKVKFVGSGETVIYAILQNSDRPTAYCNLSVSRPDVEKYKIIQKDRGITIPVADRSKCTKEADEANRAYDPNDIFIYQYFANMVCDKEYSTKSVFDAGCRVCSTAMFSLMKANIRAKINGNTDNTYYAVKSAYKDATNEHANMLDTFSYQYKVAEGYISESCGDTYTVTGRNLFNTDIRAALNNAGSLQLGEKAYMLVVKLDDYSGEFDHGVIVYGKDENAALNSSDTHGYGKVLIIDPSGAPGYQVTDLYTMLCRRASNHSDIIPTQFIELT